MSMWWVARMLGRYPELMPRVKLIMSFDIWRMHLLRNEFTRVTGAVGGGGTTRAKGRRGFVVRAVVVLPTTV